LKKNLEKKFSEKFFNYQIPLIQTKKSNFLFLKN